MPPPPLIPLANLAPPPSGAAPQLTAEHFQQIALARTGWKRIRRAVGMARFDGWTIGLFGAITLICSLTSIPGLALGAGMLAIATIELRGAARLGKLDPAAPRVLGLNQLAVATMLTVYAGWNMYAATNGPSAHAAMTADERELANMLGPIDELTRDFSFAVYGLLIVVAIFGQGSLALYYFSRTRHVRDYLAQTPPWIAEMQRAGVVL